MKKLSGFLFGVAVLCLYLTAHAQTQDTALARIDDQAIKKSDHRMIETTETSTNSSLTKKEEAAPQVKFIVPETKDSKKRSILDTKAGPNGEDIQIDKNGYYYFDAAGKKVRTDVKALRDKPKHS